MENGGNFADDFIAGLTHQKPWHDRLPKAAFFATYRHLRRLVWDQAVRTHINTHTFMSQTLISSYHHAPLYHTLQQTSFSFSFSSIFSSTLSPSFSPSFSPTISPSSSPILHPCSQQVLRPDLIDAPIDLTAGRGDGLGPWNKNSMEPSRLLLCLFLTLKPLILNPYLNPADNRTVLTY